MGGFFGAASKNDCIADVFFGTDYHSHLGTRRGGMTSYSDDKGFQRSIHSIENFYAVLERQRKLEKEVSAIAKGKSNKPRSGKRKG